MDHVENKASKNIIEDNIEKLKDLFPEAFTESSDEGEPRWKVDFETLKQILGDYTENRQERYSFSWNGKSRARLIAQTPSTGTLRPCPEESVDWDTTKNLFIEGDNLEVLKLLQKSYHKKVKMIYIDPPYNTGNEFIYPDKFQDNLDTYLRYTGQVDDEGFKVSTNSETGGRYHTNWLNMMYPRLKLARNLLRDDGVIFISVGKEELHNLIKTMNEIYGEECHKNIIVIRRGIKSVQAQFETIDSFNRGHEYLVFYSKSSNYRFNKCLIPNTFDDEEEVEGSWNNHWRGTDRPTMRYELFGIKPKNGQWRWGEARSLKAKENWKNLCEEIGSNPSQKEIDTWVMKKEKEYGERIDLLRLSSTSKPEHYIHPSEGKLASDLWSDLKPNGGNQFKRIMEGNYFDTPKSVDLIYRLLSFLSGPNDIVLDFFAGSATTAHSTFKLNCEENSFRNFIMVQLPEPTKEDSEAYKAGYKTIAEIGKERIRRAAKKIQGEHPEYDGDLGFQT
jgi:adenine-specific DNA-methyltransferase